MGVSFAKSVKFGAIRFNFSGGGIGVSVGIPGLRIGTGPRGADIAGGAAGFRYRKSLGAGPLSPRANGSVPISPSFVPGGGPSPMVDPNIVATVDHETKNVLELADSSSDALLQSMNEQRNKQSLWPFVAAGLAALFLVLNNVGFTWNSAVLPAFFLIFVSCTLWVRWRDNMRKLTVLFFEPDAQTSSLFETLSDAAQNAATARKLKSIANTSRYGDTKYTAGASEGLKLENAKFFLGQAPGVVANVDVPILQASKTTLAFYPDRILAFQGKSVGSIGYKELGVNSAPVRFIEKESVPSDALVIDKTWQYVNKKGGPDKRFKNNRQLPICKYNQLNLSTSSGLDIRFMGSRDGTFDSLVQAINKVGRTS